MLKRTTASAAAAAAAVAHLPRTLSQLVQVMSYQLANLPPEQQEDKKLLKTAERL